MILPIILVFSILCIVLFLLGVYTGLYLARNSREVVVREVEKVVPTERVVTVEKPVMVRVPAPEPQRQPNGPSLPILGNNTRNVISDPRERAQYEHMNDLLQQLPEA